MEGLLALAAPAGLAADTLLYVLLYRGTKSHAVSVGGGAAAGLALTLVLSAAGGRGLAPADAAGKLVLNALAFAALEFGFWNFLNMNITSVRTRIVRELHERGFLPRAELLGRYDPRQIALVRIERLVRYGRLKEEGATVVLKPQPLVFVGSVIEGIKHLLLGRGSRLLERPRGGAA